MKVVAASANDCLVVEDGDYSLIVYPAFVIRLSNQEYSADQFEDFQKHFTLMSLLDDSSIGPIRKAGQVY